MKYLFYFIFYLTYLKDIARKILFYINNFSERHDEFYIKNFDYELILDIHAEGDEDKELEPTEHKKRKAREEEGKVFLTQELPQALVLLTGFSVIAILSVYFYTEIKNLLVKYISGSFGLKISLQNINMLYSDVFITFVKILLPLGGIVVTVTVFSTMIQTNFYFSTKTLKFDIKRIAFSFENFKKKTIFSKNQIINMIKMIFKMFIIGIIAYIYIKTNMNKFIAFVNTDIKLSFATTLIILLKLIITIAGIFLLLAIPDYLIQKYLYIQDLKMSVQEMKEEMKELEGNPEIKAKLKERRKQIAYKNMMNEVPNADVIVTNPTHIACALQYDNRYMDRPKLIAKGMDKTAEKIKQLAKENNIIIIEQKPLAREIYKKVDIGEFIPDELIRAVVDIFVIVYKSKQEAA